MQSRSHGLDRFPDVRFELLEVGRLAVAAQELDDLADEPPALRIPLHDHRESLLGRRAQLSGIVLGLAASTSRVIAACLMMVRASKAPGGSALF